MLINQAAQPLEDWNETPREVPPTATLPQLYEQQVEKTPETVALIYQEQELNYRELNERANRLAHLLIKKGIGPEDVVALMLPRSQEMIVSLLAILKTGAAYLPIDPEYPSARVAFMLEDAEPACLITNTEFEERLPVKPHRLLLNQTELTRALEQSPCTNPE